jgi:hypothetical protein
VAVSVAVPVGLGFGFAEAFPALGRTPIYLGGALGLVAWLADCVLLAAAGAWQLRRFDVARDRG